MRTAYDALEVLRPRTLKEALTMLQGEGELCPLAGGTDLFVLLGAGAWPEKAPRRFLDLWPLDELRGIAAAGKRRPRLELGALTTYSDCQRAKLVRRHLPILAAAAAEVGGVQIQNRGTLGGNIGNGSPAGDSLPVLFAAGATVVLQSRARGEREVPFAEFYTGYRRSVRRPDELIVRIEIPIPDPTHRQYFRKVGTRAAQAISKVVLAAVGNRLAVGSVAPTVVGLPKVESYLDEGGHDPARLDELVAQDIHPIDDIRSTAAYRLQVTKNLVRDCVGGRS